MKTGAQTLLFDNESEYKLQFENIIINNHWRKRARKLRNRKWREINQKTTDDGNDDYDVTLYKGWKYE